MSKKIGLAPKTNKEKKEAVRQLEQKGLRQIEQYEKSVYIGTLTNRVVDAINEIFSKTEPLPNVQDITDVLALAPVFILSKQVANFNTKTEVRQAMMRGCVWSLKNAVDTFADPLIRTEEAWADIIGAEGGEDDKV